MDNAHLENIHNQLIPGPARLPILFFIEAILNVYRKIFHTTSASLPATLPILILLMQF